jgi:hypothetical protein
MAADHGAVLVEERRFYESQREKLLEQSEGKFALIHGAHLLGVYDTGKAAYEAGVKQLGNVPMLIVQVLRKEPTESVSPALHAGLISASPYT